ncbi:insulinase family protein, partial [Patescibacteria group bacterium]|nr:insulinase family protein [Patescibacteria group bacterium]
MYKIIKLPNQLEVITAPLSSTKTITVLVMVATGSRFENLTNSGISHFLEHLFFKGTTKRPTTLAISSELDRVGGEFNAFTSKEYTGYFVKVEASQLPLALDVLSDMLLNSKFETAEIEREKGVIIEELNMYLDNPLIYIEDLFEERLYGNTPAGRDTIGTKETILKIDRKKILDYAGAQYSSDKMIISLTGGFKPGAIKLINKY